MLVRCCVGIGEIADESVPHAVEHSAIPTSNQACRSVARTRITCASCRDRLNRYRPDLPIWPVDRRRGIGHVVRVGRCRVRHRSGVGSWRIGQDPRQLLKLGGSPGSIARVYSESPSVSSASLPLAWLMRGIPGSPAFPLRTGMRSYVPSEYLHRLLVDPTLVSMVSRSHRSESRCRSSVVTARRSLGRSWRIDTDQITVTLLCAQLMRTAVGSTAAARWSSLALHLWPRCSCGVVDDIKQIPTWGQRFASCARIFAPRVGLTAALSVPVDEATAILRSG